MQPDCQSLPGFSRHGEVRDIAIRDRLSAATIQVNTGDEIRWTNKRMTWIAQVAPLRDSVPPQHHGGTERIVSYLTDELVRLGHEVTLFATSNSSTSAALFAPCSSSLRSTPKISLPDAPWCLLLERAFGTYAGNFNLIHSHIEILAFPHARRCRTPVLTTLYDRLDLPELVQVFQQVSELPVVSVSETQRGPMPWIKWQGTIHPGLPQNLYSIHPNLGRYLAFLGRISPGRGVEQAIELAEQTDMPIRIAARIDPLDRNYFEHIAPLSEHPLVEYVGEVTDGEKDEFLGEAYALICPVDHGSNQLMPQFTCSLTSDDARIEEAA